MVTFTLVLVVLVIAALVWRQRSRRGPSPRTGLVTALVDHGRDLIAPLYPSPPLSRRALPRRLLRAAKQTITVGVSGMVLVPTRIRIAVNPADLEPFSDAMEWLQRDLAEALRQEAAANGWVVPDGPEVVVVADDERPVRLPRAVGRIDAFRPDDVRTRRRTVPPPVSPPASSPSASPAPPPGPSPSPAPAPEPTAMTSMVVGADEAPGAVDDLDQPTVAEHATVHLRLVAVGERHDTGEGDLNALLVATDAPLVLGRSREADLQVKDRQVSARHCALSVDPEDRSVRLRDLRSTNGTYVDGQRVDAATLTSGTTLRVGNVSWRVELDPVTS